MPADASIYGNVQTPQINIPNPMDMAAKSMQLSQLGMQQMQMARQLQTQSAMQSAYAHNTDPATGQLDQSGYLSDLGRMSPMAAQQETGRLAEQNKQVGEAQAARADAAYKSLKITGPALDYFNKNTPADQKATVWPTVINQIINVGVDTTNLIHPFDQGLLDSYLTTFYNPQTQAHLESLAAQKNIVKTEADTGEAQAKTAEAYANTAKTRSETPNGATAPVTANIDPATLVPQMVPKELRPKAFEEIKNAADINSLTPKIMAAFQMGSSRNPNTAAQGQREFEGLINTTVKETEGTARQAAFDSIHKTMTPSGPLAFPGENEAKAATILSYLQSKSSAPTAKAYGIDLSKFNSTGPYKGPQTDSGSAAKGSGGTPAPAPSANDTAALKWLKTADPSSPEAFGIRAKLKKKGLL